MAKPFDPTITALAEGPEALNAINNAIADRNQIDKRIAEKGIDTEGALIAMYGGITKVDESEVQAARDEEAQEPDADAVLAELDGVSGGEENKSLVGSAGDDGIGGENEPAKTGVEENGNIDGGNQVKNVDGTGEQTPDIERQKEEHPMTPSVKHLRKSGKIKTQQEEDELIEHFANDGSIEDIGTLESMKDAENLQELKDLLGDMTANEEKSETNITDFTETFGNDLGTERDKKGGYTNQSDENAVNMIGSHFNMIDTGDKVRDTKNALSTAFESAHNNLIDGKQFPRNKTFEENSKRVLDENSSPKERFEAFKKIMFHVETHQALGGKKDTEALNEGAEEKLQIAGIEKEFYATLAEFKKEPEGPKQIKLGQKLEALRVEAKLTEGEASLLAGGELDKASDTLGENTTKTA